MGHHMFSALRTSLVISSVTVAHTESMMRSLFSTSNRFRKLITVSLAYLTLLSLLLTSAGLTSRCWGAKTIICIVTFTYCDPECVEVNHLW